jgi:hypothetical protein
MTGSPLLVVCALRAELWALRGGAWGEAPYGVRLLRSGMGAARTRSAVSAAFGEADGTAPGALLVTGFCAAAAPGPRPGEVLVAERVQDAEGTAAELPGAAALAERLRAAGLAARTGVLHSAEKVVRGAARGELAARGVHGIDMETAAALRRVPAGLPVAAVRVVVDTPDHELLRPGTLVGGARAWRALRRAAPVFAVWHRELVGLPRPAAGTRAP